jgi:hypothetical protein
MQGIVTFGARQFTAKSEPNGNGAAGWIGVYCLGAQQLMKWRPLYFLAETCQCATAVSNHPALA